MDRSSPPGPTNLGGVWHLEARCEAEDSEKFTDVGIHVGPVRPGLKVSNAATSDSPANGASEQRSCKPNYRRNNQDKPRSVPGKQACSRGCERSQTDAPPSCAPCIERRGMFSAKN